MQQANPAGWDEVTMPDPILSILQRYRTLVVVGLSSNPTRPSHGVSAYMKAHGYRIIPVNPNEKEVLGEKAFGSLEEVPEPVEVVVIFRRPEFVPAVVESAIAKRAKVIWMQEGIIHEEAARRAREAGLEVIQDHCILKAHARRFVTESI